MGNWKENDIREKLKKLCRKENLLVVGLVGAILIVISLPIGSKNTEKVKEVKKVAVENREVSDKESLERKLEELLGQVDGVGKVNS